MPCQISSEWVYSVALEGQKLPILPHFQPHYMVAPPSGATTVSKPFLYSNALMATSLAQTLPFKNVTDKTGKTEHFPALCDAADSAKVPYDLSKVSP